MSASRYFASCHTSFTIASKVYFIFGCILLFYPTRLEFIIRKNLTAQIEKAHVRGYI